MNRRKRDSGKSVDQSTRFIEAAKKAGVDESGRKFVKVFKQVVKPKPGKTS